MRNKCLMFIASIAVLAGLAIPVRVDAQEIQERRRDHLRYNFYDLGTFGSVNSDVNSDSVVINSEGCARLARRNNGFARRPPQ